MGSAKIEAWERDRARLADLHKLWLRAFRAERANGGDTLACVAAANKAAPGLT